MSPIFAAAAAFCHLLAFSASFFPSLAFSQTVFSYNGFDSADATTISLFQGSSFSDGKIQLTATGAIQGMGRSLFSHPIQLLDSSSGAPLSFSTQFIFSMQPGPEDLADGLAFVISPVLGGMPNSSQGLLGILSNDSNGKSSSHTFAVEFDAYKNPELQDIDGNHVGIDINNVVSWEAVSAAYKSSEVLESAADGYEVALKGQMIQAWIDYDGSTTQLNVSISPKLGVKPMFPLISNSSVNLSGILEDQMYVGFSASTGPLSDVLYYVYAWSFSNNGSSAPVSIPDRDEKTEKITMILGIVFGLFAGVLLLLAGLSFVLLRRRRRKYSRGKKTEWQLDSLWVDHLPQKFSYSELSKATKGFHEHNLLGSGGFGSVYRGVLPSSGLAVAVKRISKESKQGVKEFVSEVSTIGRLRHRNLVPLLGWCEERGLMLVYELMPNGSLDKHLFSKEEGNKLPWASRFNIVKGVAAALLYLHEECEQKIVHRDVKPSNVMLDAEMNARLGDFGLARLYSHDAIPETTNVAGTWGYLAPECFATRKASGKADVYSLGAVMLEATTGRKMTESREGDDDVSMVEWLWRLGVKGEMVKAMDWQLLAMASTENLEREKMETEMEMVLKLSLWCLQTDPMSRPPIRRIVQILAGDASLPVDFFSSASSIAIACMELRSYSDPSMLSSSSSSHFSSEALLNPSSRHDFSSHTTASSITNPPAIPPH